MPDTFSEAIEKMAKIATTMGVSLMDAVDSMKQAMLGGFQLPSLYSIEEEEEIENIEYHNMMEFK